ncbi:MAG: diguanylate cyclase domain-containing protein [Microthrixaceae bacterium]
MAERAYEALGDEFALALAMLDSALVIQWCNPAAGRVLGWPDDQLVGRNAADFVHPDDVVNFVPIAGEMSAMAERHGAPPRPSAPVELPCRILRSDGGWTPMVVTGRVLDGDGNILAVIRPSAERHALAEVLDGLGSAAPMEQMLQALVGLIRAQFDSDVAWVVHDSRGGAVVIGSDESAVPFDPAGVLARLRAFDSEDWFVLVEGNLWVMPVRAGEGEGVFAAFVIPAIRPEGPTPWDELVARRTTRLCSVAFTRDLRDRMLEVAATTDHLTGALNRREFERTLRTGSTEAMPVTLFFLDLDDFKVINDDFGHLAGDAVLANVARRLQRVVRSHDRVGRLGGDEFVISCPGLAEADVESTRRRITAVVEEPVAIDGRKLQVTASVGVARAFNEEQLETVITRSDADMFHRKRSRGEAPSSR